MGQVKHDWNCFEICDSYTNALDDLDRSTKKIKIPPPNLTALGSYLSFETKFGQFRPETMGPCFLRDWNVGKFGFGENHTFVSATQCIGIGTTNFKKGSDGLYWGMIVK